MTFTRRTILALTAATALAGGLPALAADLPEGGTVAAVENTKGPLKIAFMAFQNNPFWVPVTDGAKAAAAYLKDHDTQVDYVDLGDNLNAEAVISGIESAVAQKYDGIVIVPIFDGTERAINEATAAGVPVFNIIAEGSVPSDRLAFIGQDATAAGQQLGEFIAKKLDGKGKVGVITGYFGAVQHNRADERGGGLSQGQRAGHRDRRAVREPGQGRGRLFAGAGHVHGQPRPLPRLRDRGRPFGAAKAVKDLGLTGKVGVVGFDHTPDNMEYIKSGEMWALIDQAPFRQAFNSTVTLYNTLVTGEAPKEKVIRVEGNIVTPETATN